MGIDFEIFPIRGTAIEEQHYPIIVCSGFILIGSIVMAVIEVRFIVNLNELFDKILMRYGKDQLLKNNIKNQFNQKVLEFMNKAKKVSP